MTEDNGAAARTDNDLIDLSTEIVCAYVSHNALSMTDLPKLIADVHLALRGLRSETALPIVEELKPAVAVQEIGRARLHHLPRRRQEVQVAEAPSAHALRSVARGISREVGPAARLSDGRAQLLGDPLAPRQGQRPRPQSQVRLSLLSSLRPPSRRPFYFRASIWRQTIFSALQNTYPRYSAPP